MGEKRASMVLYVPLRLFVVQGRHESVRREDHHLVRRLVHVLDEEDNLRSSNRHLQPALCPQSQLTADAKQRLASFHTSRLDSAELAHTALVPIARASGLQIQQFHVASLLLAYITLSLSPHADGAEDDILPLMTSPVKDAPKSECCICGTPIDSGAEGETWRGHAQICTSHEGHTAHISCQRALPAKACLRVLHYLQEPSDLLSLALVSRAFYSYVNYCCEEWASRKHNLLRNSHVKPGVWYKVWEQVAPRARQSFEDSSEHLVADSPTEAETEIAVPCEASTFPTGLIRSIVLGSLQSAEGLISNIEQPRRRPRRRGRQLRPSRTS
ncbi:uncharacterized protein B0I36DRAFT_33925 [Microdochium trichocladiopsis]|uniref:F-box domain-containing protein n=1 Tax=Microdochium trichocladiopsis TaxID=1682393 RepID=A0A9P9BP83_9PEZI|nr:uncharacterized protein B0I36DRAFT_33925 [Microdochium trichocladiopsis]KAH7021628.1 hypothetical protein B0I36DRAFT_33925 [Microdochium trichocladiopsis]